MQYLTEITQGFVKSAVQIDKNKHWLCLTTNSEVKYGCGRFFFFPIFFMFVCVCQCIWDVFTRVCIK